MHSIHRSLCFLLQLLSGLDALFLIANILLTFHIYLLFIFPVSATVCSLHDFFDAHF